MPDDLWNFARNCYLSATTDNESLAGDLIADGLDRLNAAAADYPDFVPLVAPTISVKFLWDGADAAVDNGEAGVRGATLAFEDFLAGLTRKPNATTNSPIAAWDNVIIGAVSAGSPIYLTLLPNGHDTLTTGTYVQQLAAIKNFADRCGEQTAFAALVTLKATVLAWHAVATGLRESQNDQKAELVQARADRAVARVAVCQRLMATIGMGISIWVTTQERVETLVDRAMLSNPPQAVPGVPGATTWTPAARRLSVAALPSGATKLVAWRLGPGGAPEQLAVGEFREAEVIIPVSITWESGKTYQLWLTGKNSRGQSEPGQIITWTAP